MRGRVRNYPPAFAARHPVRMARNLVGNHPSRLADGYLSGLQGVEIGGSAHNDFFLDTVNVDHVADPPTAADQLRYAGRTLPVDVVAPADELPFADDSYDFVLASHALEHVPDPIAALKEWTRVARRYLFIVLPSRSNPYDHGRPLTPLSELVERHARAFTSAESHHWNVWDADAFCDLLRHLSLEVVEVQDPDDKRGNGFAVVVGVS
jgi:SAM-dependent methyltransferase